MCRTLRSIADLGLTVVAVIHQPRLEIFNTFDDLLLLAPGGLTAYIGPRGEVQPHVRCHAQSCTNGGVWQPAQLPASALSMIHCCSARAHARWQWSAGRLYA